jgi:hypothetical protein
MYAGWRFGRWMPYRDSWPSFQNTTFHTRRNGFRVNLRSGPGTMLTGTINYPCIATQFGSEKEISAVCRRFAHGGTHLRFCTFLGSQQYASCPRVFKRPKPEHENRRMRSRVGHHRSPQLKYLKEGQGLSLNPRRSRYRLTIRPSSRTGFRQISWLF